MQPYWLKVCLDDVGSKWPYEISKYKVIIDHQKCLQFVGTGDKCRISPIYPVVESDLLDNECVDFEILFYCVDNAFSLIGRVLSRGSDTLKKSLFCSLGMASIILISNKKSVGDEFLQIIEGKVTGYEYWSIRNNILNKIDYNYCKEELLDLNKIKILEYDVLSVVERAMIDEFVSNVSLLLPRVSIYMSSEMEYFIELIGEVNGLIKEIVYLSVLSGEIPVSLKKYEAFDLKNNYIIREQIKHQAIDKIIQINSSLSYYSVQVLSGAIPILERRSLIRRYSLLGIGSAIIGLKKIARSIENALYSSPVELVIQKCFLKAKPLPPIYKLYYDNSYWDSVLSVNDFESDVSGMTCRKMRKFPFFSYRLGYRETEFSISAAIQSITGGAGLDWSLFTITHEMLHGHVRIIMASLFRGDKSKTEYEKRKDFYDKYYDFYVNQSEDVYFLDSVRCIIFFYCCAVSLYGSLTRESDIESVVNNDERLEIEVLPINELWDILQEENRNISEIFVHVLDYYYFYDGRLSVYIPLIWRTWSCVPHVYSDLRQYILRSLLVIAANESEGTPKQRFEKSRSRLIELLSDYDIPVKDEIVEFLKQRAEDVFFAYKATLVLVDLVKSVFVSHKVMRLLYGDTRIHRVDEIDKSENAFEYRLPDGFFEEVIDRPAAYMLHLMTKKLSGAGNDLIDLEFETLRLFLSCASANEIVE